MHQNDLFWRLKFRQSGQEYSYTPVSFMVNILPSVSYYIKF